MVRTSGIPFEYLSQMVHWPTIQAFWRQHALHLRHFWQGGVTVIIIMVIGKLISLGWKLTIVRLGPETLGTTQLILTALTLLTSFALFGMQTSLGRFASIAWQQHRFTRAHQLLMTSLKWCGIVAVLIAIGCWWEPAWVRAVLRLPTVATQDLRLLGLAVPFAITSELLWSYLAVQRRVFVYGTTRYLLLPLARLGLLILLMAAHLPPSQVIVGHLVGAVIITAILTWWLGRFQLRVQIPALPAPLRRRFAHYSASIAGSFLLFMVYGSVDVLLLNRFSTLERVGLLSALFIFTELADVFFAGFLNLFHSFLSSFHKDPVTGLKFTLVTAAGLLSGGLILSLVLTLLRAPLIALFLGPEYQIIGHLIGLALILKSFESSIVFSLHHYLDFYGYVKATIGLMALGLAIKVIAGWWLIGHYNLIGVLYTQGLAIAFQVVCCSIVIGLIIWAKHPWWLALKRRLVLG